MTNQQKHSQSTLGAFNDYVDTILSFFTITYLNVDIFNFERGQKMAFFDQLLPLFDHVVNEYPNRY